jgi:putative heme-binding domain-containing protein
MNYNSFAQEQIDSADRPHWDQHLGPADERLRWEAFGLRKWPMAKAESREVPDTDAGNSIRRTWLWALARSATPLAQKSAENVLDGLIAKALFGPNQTNIDTPLLDKLANWVPAKQQKWTTRDQLEFFTTLQVSLGERRYSLPQQVDPPQPDVLDGYKGLSSSRLPENLRKAWTDWALFFAQKAIDLDSPLLHLEATRTLSMLEPKNSEAVSFLLGQITDKSHPTSDIHWLCCSANCSSPRTAEMTTMTAQALAGIIRKVKQRGLYTDNQWPIRLQQLVAALLKRDANLGAAFVDLPIPCCPEDLALLSAFPIDVQANARSKMKRHLVSSEISDWSPAILRYACQAGIDDALAAKIREATAEPKLKTVAIELLATRANETDYGLFLSALESQDRDQWALGWKGIASLPTLDSKREMTALAPVVSSVLNSNTNLPRAKVLQRVRLVSTKIDRTDGMKPPATELWLDWERYFQNTLSEDDFAKLLKPNIAIDWTAMLQQASLIKGDSEKGKILYQEKCALCHGGQSSLGPSLSGVAKRFSREDLSKAIFEPSRDISERYRAIRVLTIDDEIYTGMIVYNAADGTTLQTATGTIVRINQDNIQDKGYSTESLMPSGLLDDKSPQDVANLFAYLDGL